jgi:hypothetical protein
MVTPSDTFIYEFRLHEVASDRLAAEVARMHRVAIAGEPQSVDGPAGPGPSMFDRYGIPRPLGVWTGVTGARTPQFGYLLRWDSLAKRDNAFPRFWADPLWKQLRNQSDNGVPMVERTEDWLLRPSAFSGSSAGSKDIDADCLTEILIQRVENGYAAEAGQVHAATLLPILATLGATVLGVFDVVIGPDMPAMMTFLAWPDQHTQEASWRAVDGNRQVLEEIRRQRDVYGRALVRSAEHNLMKPVGFGIPVTDFGRIMT